MSIYSDFEKILSTKYKYIHDISIDGASIYKGPRIQIANLCKVPVLDINNFVRGNHHRYYHVLDNFDSMLESYKNNIRIPNFYTIFTPLTNKEISIITNIWNTYKDLL